MCVCVCVLIYKLVCVLWTVKGLNTQKRIDRFLMNDQNDPISLFVFGVVRGVGGYVT